MQTEPINAVPESVSTDTTVDTTFTTNLGVTPTPPKDEAWIIASLLKLAKVVGVEL